MTALGKSDYAAAAGLFTEAQSDYQAAVKESVLEADLTAQLAVLRTNLDQAHAAVAARRQQALAADADNLARDLFDRAKLGKLRVTSWRAARISPAPRGRIVRQPRGMEKRCPGRGRRGPRGEEEDAMNESRSDPE